MTDLEKAIQFFDKAAEPTGDVIPKGFYTARQFADQRGVVRAQDIKRKLDHLVSRGLAECRVFKVGSYRAMHYKMLVGR